MNEKLIKIVLGTLLLGASVAVLLSLTAFSDIHDINKIQVSQREGLSLYLDKKGRPLSGIVRVDDKQIKGARINIPVKNGLRDGMVKQFDADAKKIAEFPFVEGLLHGEASYFDRQGNVVARSTYEHGLKHGPEVECEDGRMLSESIFDQGELVSFAQFDLAGNLTCSIIRLPGGDYTAFAYQLNADEVTKLELEFDALPDGQSVPHIP